MKSTLDRAALIAGVDPAKIDFALLVGMLARLQTWHENESRLAALAKGSMCTGIRAEGVALLEKFAQEASIGNEGHASHPVKEIA